MRARTSCEIRGSIVISGLLAAALLGGCGFEPEPGEPAEAKPAPELSRYIVVLDDSVGPDEVVGKARALVSDLRPGATSLALDKLRRRHQDVEVEAALYHDFVFRRVFPGFVVALDEQDEAALAALRAHPDVVSVTPDREVQATAQSSEPGMQRIRVAQNATAAINGVDDVRIDADIAVIDSGIDPSHPDLNVYHSVSLRDDDPSLGDPNGHGTHVAGIAAALDNDIGVHGVAPGARLWSIKIIDAGGSTTDSLIVAGLEYALEHADEIDVVNLSLAGFGGEPDDRSCGRTSGEPIHLAVCGLVESGVVVVAAAGNGLPFFGDPAPAEMFYPARYDEVITVSAVTELDGVGPGDAIDPSPAEDRLWSKSNFGYEVDIAAPGVDVISTLPGNDYGPMTGTSMAAPHVAGAAALWIVDNGRPRTKAEVRAVRDELVRLGFPQNGADNGFFDRETYAEPFLDVAPINRRGGDLVEPLLSLDSFYFDYRQSCPLLVVVDVEDRSGNPITGLPSNAFIPHIRGRQVPAEFRALGRGQYALAVDISQLPPNRHDVHVIVKDGSGSSRTAGAQFVVRTREPSLVIQSLDPYAPIVTPGTSYQGFLAAVTFGDGRPATFSNGASVSFDYQYDGTGSLLFGFYFPGLAYGVYSASTSAASLAIGTYSLELTATAGELSATAKTSFEVADPDPSVSAELVLNTQVFDFSQSVPPQDLVVDVAVVDELLKPIAGLGSDDVVVFIDGQSVAGVELSEHPPYSGIYRSTGIDLGFLAEGGHTVRAEVTDSRGLVASSKEARVEVIKTAGPKLGLVLDPSCTTK